MPRICASASAVLESPPQAVYSLLADYRDGHPGILPERYFSGLEVESGGVGAGTVIRFRIHAFGSTHTVRARIEEPEPGRVLTETSLDNGAVTTFVVEPLLSGRRTSVTITTRWDGRGARGWIERLAAPRFLRRVYAEELAKLGRMAAERPVLKRPARALA